VGSTQAQGSVKALLEVYVVVTSLSQAVVEGSVVADGEKDMGAGLGIQQQAPRHRPETKPHPHLGVADCGVVVWNIEVQNPGHLGAFE
jgi:hypothetical protein